MPDKKYMRSFICWVVATVMLAASMGSRAVSPVQQASLQSIEKSADAADSSPQENPTEQTVVSALSLDAVVISLFSFHFSQYLVPVSPIAIKFRETISPLFPPRFSEPLFFFCYFHKVFGKQIAANAP